MFCSNCGKEMPDFYDVCSNCGTALRSGDDEKFRPNNGYSAVPGPNNGYSETPRPNNGYSEAFRPNNGYSEAFRPNNGYSEAFRPNNGYSEAPRPDNGYRNYGYNEVFKPDNKFNFAAFLFGIFWLMVKGMWDAAGIMLGFIIIITFIPGGDPTWSFVASIIFSVFWGRNGNYYYRLKEQMGISFVRAFKDPQLRKM